MTLLVPFSMSGIACVAAVSFPFPNAREGNENCERFLTPSPLLSIFLLTPGARPFYRSLVRFPPGKGKETAATQAMSGSIYVTGKIRCRVARGEPQLSKYGNPSMRESIQTWTENGNPKRPPLLLKWSVDSCQNNISADLYHLTILRAQV